MAGSVGTIYYEVEARTGKLLSAEREVDRATGSMEKGFDGVGDASDRLNTRLSKLATMIKAVVAASAVKQMAHWVQSYREMAERVKDATDSVAEFDMVQARLKDTAAGTYRELSEVQETFIQSSRALKNMGYTTSEAIDVVDSLSYAFVRNATSNDKAKSAMNALVRATNRGTVLTEHWASLLVAVPTILADVASATGKAEQEISQLGYSGQLTADMLTEGLRRSLEENKAAADEMANQMTDAGIRVREAITSMLFAAEEQTGVLQAVTDGIIMAADAVVSFADDADGLATLFKAMEVAATSAAAVFAGRLLSSLASSTAELYRKTLGARAVAVAELNAAKSADALAAAELRQAQAAAAAATGLGHHGAALQRLAAAEAAAAAASGRLAAAQTAMGAAFSVSAAAARGLRTALGFLGGPAGIILLVASALWQMRDSARDADDALSSMADGVDKLTEKQLQFRKIQLQEELEKQERAAAKLEMRYKDMTRQVEEGLMRSESFRRKIAETGAQMDAARADATKYADALRDVNAELGRRAEGADVGPQRPADWKPQTPVRAAGGADGSGGGESDYARQKRQLEQQIELTRKSGQARAELAALQKLGANASAEEKARIKELAGELFRLEAAQKAAAAASDDRRQAARRAADAERDNVRVIEGLSEALYQTTLSAEALAMRQAELSLNEYATPEQVEVVRDLARALWEAEEAERVAAENRRKFGDDPLKYVRGDVSPLSGGAFDEQVARYEKEAEAEQKRFEEQQARLIEALQAEQITLDTYYRTFEEMASEHADRMGQIEAAKNQMLVQSAGSIFGSLADAIKGYAGEASSAYKALFAISKAFAIAQSIVAIQTGIAQAAAQPFPASLAAMAQVAAQTAGIVSTISGTQMAGGRQYGGPVEAGGAYRINEDGRPEILQSANGQQFLLPNTRGEVISNKDAQGGGAASLNVVVNLVENRDRAGMVEQRQEDDGSATIDIFVADIQGDGRSADAIRRKFGLQDVGV